MIPDWQKALDRVLWSWDGTPWIAGQQLRGKDGGVDCTHFVVGVLDELHRLNLPPIKRHPQDLGLHDPRAAFIAMKEIVSRYPNVVVKDGSLEPGDVVVCRNGSAAGEGHVLIAGYYPGELWHAANMVGVCRTSISLMKDVMWNFRPIGREQWRF